jgi:hypothetical protein
MKREESDEKKKVRKGGLMYLYVKDRVVSTVK